MKDYGSADETMRAYVRARESFQLKAVQVTTSGVRSKCCHGPVLLTPPSKRWPEGRLECSRCMRPCDAEEWFEPKRGSGPSPDAEQDRLAGALDRWMRLQRIVEQVPPGIEPEIWRRYLVAWEWYLDARTRCRSDVVEILTKKHHDLGPWTEWGVRKGVSIARQEVGIKIRRMAAESALVE